MSQFKLTKVIIENSLAKSWDEARLEWELVGIERTDDAQECVCGHFPINEICTIQNPKTKNALEVGNHCVQKFIGLDSEKLFASLRRVAKKHDGSFNPEIIDFVYKSGIINKNARDFYVDIWRKRVLSEKQTAWKLSINKDILRAVKVGKIFIS
jgi:hypothetical protein